MTTVVPLTPSVRERMQRQRRADTRPELLLRRELWRRGFRYRVDVPVLDRRRRVDIVFTRLRVAVFVDGCFWHACPVHGSLPKNNREWWSEKLQKNTQRDRVADAALVSAGWIVVRVWEHEPAADAADRVAELLQQQRSALNINRTTSP